MTPEEFAVFIRRPQTTALLTRLTEENKQLDAELIFKAGIRSFFQRTEPVSKGDDR